MDLRPLRTGWYGMVWHYHIITELLLGNPGQWPIGESQSTIDYYHLFGSCSASKSSSPYGLYPRRIQTDD
jgi:hypothetical protein